MLPNEFVSIEHIANHYRSSYRRFAGFNQCVKVANEILSELDADSFRKYGELPFVTSQVVTLGAIDVYKYFVTFPKPSKSRYVLRFEVINDLPF